MSFILKSIELSNIRSFDHIVFTPSDSGVTSILGKNGTGKSTIVDSVAWALFGTKIGKMKNSAIMKSGVPYEKDKFYARITIEVDGQQLLVERKFVSKGGAVEADVYSINSDDTDDEFTHIAGPAVSHAEKYIRQRLGMDERGFLSSVLVQQKEVDKLISAQAKDRAGVIEDLTGITALTRALDTARKEYNALKKASTVSSADSESIKEYEDRFYELTREKNALQQDLEERKEDLSLLKKEGVDIKSKYDTYQKKFKEKESLESQLKIAESQCSTSITLRDEAIEERNEIKDSLDGMTSAESAEKVIAKKDKLVHEKNEKYASIAAVSSEIKNAQKSIKSQENVVSEFIESNDITTELTIQSVETLLSEYSQNLDKEKENKKNNEESLSANKSSISSLESAIEVLSKDDGTCPTCLQKVSDAHDAIASLQSEVESFQEKNSLIMKSVEESQQKISELHEFYENLVHVKNALQKNEEFTRDLKTLNENYEVLSGEYRVIKDELDSIHKKAENASHIIYRLEEYQKALKKAQKYSKEVNSLNLKIDGYRDDLREMKGISSQDISKIEKSLNSKREDYQNEEKKFIEIRGNYSVVQEKIKSTEHYLGKLREDYEKHKKLMQNLSVAASSVKIIEEFRTEQIENSIPVIENYASDFIARFTDSKFVKLTLDSRFNASVLLNDGTKRPVAALSGGELSSAAIALRLAIAMLLSNNASSCLLLDEILISMDAERASNILSVISESSQGQVILISHDEQTNAIADKTFEL